MNNELYFPYAITIKLPMIMPVKITVTKLSSRCKFKLSENAHVIPPIREIKIHQNVFIKGNTTDEKNKSPITIPTVMLAKKPSQDFSLL